MLPKGPWRVRAQYKAVDDGEMRENRNAALVREARRWQRQWYTLRLNSLLCQLDYQRVVLAKHLVRFKMAQRILREAETNIFSTGRCG